MNIYIYIITMAVITYLIRVIPLTVFTGKIKSQFLLSFLHYVPYTCLTVMTVPAIFQSTESVISAAAGFAVAIILGYFKKGLVTVAVSATVTVFVIETVMSFVL